MGGEWLGQRCQAGGSCLGFESWCVSSQRMTLSCEATIEDGEGQQGTTVKAAPGKVFPKLPSMDLLRPNELLMDA